MSTKYTPGPWEIRPPSTYEVVGDDGSLVSSGFSGDAKGGFDYKRCHANTCLITAAPELLEALQAAYAESKKGIELLGIPLISQAWHDTTGAAIAKATGEPS